MNETPKYSSRQKRKLDQVDKWKKSVYGSWQNWKSQMCMQGISLKTK